MLCVGVSLPATELNDLGCSQRLVHACHGKRGVVVVPESTKALAVVVVEEEAREDRDPTVARLNELLGTFRCDRDGGEDSEGSDGCSFVCVLEEREKEMEG